MKENDLIIKEATRNIKTRTIRYLLFSQTLQAVRINNQGAPLLGLAKSIYYLTMEIPAAGERQGKTPNVIRLSSTVALPDLYFHWPR